MENLLEILTDDEDILEVIDILQPRRLRRPKVYQPRTNHFEKWNDTEFLKRFRFSKNAVRFILEQIEDQIALPTERFVITYFKLNLL